MDDLTNGDLRGEVQRKFGGTSLSGDRLQAVSRMNSAGPSTVNSDGSIVSPAWDADVVTERAVSRDCRSERVAEWVDGVDGD